LPALSVQIAVSFDAVQPSASRSLHPLARIAAAIAVVIVKSFLICLPPNRCHNDKANPRDTDAAGLLETGKTLPCREH
jgi:hypothetical protein